MIEPRPMAGRPAEVLARGPDVGDRGGHVDLAVALLEVVEDLADPEEAHGDDDEVDPALELEGVEGEAVGAGEAVAADGGQQEPHRGGDEGLDRVAVADGGDEQDAEQGEGGVLRRAEVEGVAGDDRAEQRQSDDRHGGAEEGADRRDAEGRARLALLGQGEAVEDGHHRAGLTGDAEQHRGDGAAVLRAVVDAGEHDDRRDGVAGVVGDGQQDGHRGGGPRPGSTPMSMPITTPIRQ